jgi:uroporphyrinogen-III decarboxylase
MKEEMTRYERLMAAWNLEEADRVPSAPIMNYFIPYHAGLSVKDIFTNPEKVYQAFIEHEDLIGDNIHPCITVLDHLSLFGRCGWDQTTLNWKIWDEYPPEGNIPSIFEKRIIDDYDDVMDRGFSTILFCNGLDGDVYGRSVDDFLRYQFDYPERFARAYRKYYEERRIPMLMGGRVCHPLDLLQYYRGINDLIRDLFEEPEKVKAMCEWLSEYEAVIAMNRARVMGAGEVPGAEIIFLYNGGPPGLPPNLYDEFYLPYAKKMIDMFVNRGFRVQNHSDNDQTPYLESIATLADGLPKGTILMDFEKTDMKKAKQILGDKMCISGNVPSALMVYGSPTEVEDCCKQLIEDCGEGGGYILGVECEVPWDSKAENVIAMHAAARKYGRY